MPTEIAATAGGNGSLASVGSSIANVGATTKAFALVHPIGLAIAGGALLGIGTYYALGKVLKKKEQPITESPAAA